MIKRWTIPALLVLGLMLTACSSDNNEAPRATEVRVTAGDAALQNSQQTQDLLVANPQNIVQATEEPELTATPAPTTVSLYYGIVMTESAVLLSEPNDDGTVLKTLPNGTAITITAITDPNVIGVRFYQTAYENIAGWVASTQIELTQSGAGMTSTPAPTTTTGTPQAGTPQASATVTTEATATITPTPLPVGFPTPELYSVTIAEQIFENGRMMWFEPNDQIWILMGEEGEIDPTSGVWRCVMDTFEDGDTERSDELDPPMGTVTESEVSGASPMQPVRGFGKVWRENEEFRERLGWGLIPEQLHTTRYEYHSGGEMVDGVYQAAPGEYHIDSLFQYTIILYEGEDIKAPCEERSGTWEIR